MKERHFIFSLSSYLILFPNNNLRLLCLVLFVPGKSWQRLDFDIVQPLTLPGVLTYQHRALCLCSINNNNNLTRMLIFFWTSQKTYSLRYTVVCIL